MPRDRCARPGPQYAITINVALIAALCLTQLTTYYLRTRISHGNRVSPTIDLLGQVPDKFSNWKVSTSLPSVVAESIPGRIGTSIYDQVLSRTYINEIGDEVMLSIVFARAQYRDDTQIHRPEICYRAQGFGVERVSDETLAAGKHAVTIRRLMTSRGERFEPVSYWMLSNRETVLPGLSRKISQLRLLLLGANADGVLVRVSSLSRSEARAFRIHDAFIRDLEISLPPEIRDLLFGLSGDGAHGED